MPTKGFLLGLTVLLAGVAVQLKSDPDVLMHIMRGAGVWLVNQLSVLWALVVGIPACLQLIPFNALMAFVLVVAVSLFLFYRQAWGSLLKRWVANAPWARAIVNELVLPLLEPRLFVGVCIFWTPLLFDIGPATDAKPPSQIDILSLDTVLCFCWCAFCALGFFGVSIGIVSGSWRFLTLPARLLLLLGVGCWRLYVRLASHNISFVSALRVMLTSAPVSTTFIGALVVVPVVVAASHAQRYWKVPARSDPHAPPLGVLWRRVALQFAVGGLFTIIANCTAAELAPHIAVEARALRPLETHTAVVIPIVIVGAFLALIGFYVLFVRSVFVLSAVGALAHGLPRVEHPEVSNAGFGSMVKTIFRNLSDYVSADRAAVKAAAAGIAGAGAGAMQAVDYLLPLVRTLLQTTVEAGKSSVVTCSFEMVQKVCGFV